MTSEQHEAAEICLAELMALGKLVEMATAQPSYDAANRWFGYIGSLTYRLAHQASDT